MVRHELGVAHSTFQLTTLRDIAILSLPTLRGDRTFPLAGSSLWSSTITFTRSPRCGRDKAG